MTRVAVVKNRNVELETVQRYLPGNYEATVQKDRIIIFGEDHAGWTFDDYVQPRLASGNIFVREVKQAHEIQEVELL